MRFQGSVIREQGVTFGIVVVKPHVLQSENEKSQMQVLGRQVFGSMPIVLMAQNAHGVPTYYGRPDIVRFLSRTAMYRIPWKEYHVA